MFGIILLVLFSSNFVCSSKYSFVQITDMHIGDKKLGPKAVEYYEKVVEKVNSLVDEYNIKFAFLTGDLTDSALKEQWTASRKVSGMINIDSFPLMGNHDIWSYNDTWETLTPTGFLEYFGDMLTTQPSSGKISNYSGTDRVFNPEHNIYSYFHNFVYEYENVVFINLDWNSRKSAVKELGYKGSFPSAELHDFEHGTFRWLDDRLGEISSYVDQVSTIFFVQHHPFRCPEYIPCSVYSWSPEKKEKFRSLIVKHKIPLDKIWGDFSGHLHMWNYWDAFELEWQSKFLEWQSSAVKVDICFSLFLMEDGLLKDIKKFILKD